MNALHARRTGGTLTEEDTALVLGMVAVAVAGFALAHVLGDQWAAGEIRAAVIDARAARQGTGSLASLHRMGAGVPIVVLAPALVLVASAALSTVLGTLRRAVLTALIATALLATFTGFASAAGLGGRDLLNEHLLRTWDEEELQLHASPLVSADVLVLFLLLAVVRRAGPAIGSWLWARRHRGVASAC